MCRRNPKNKKEINKSQLNYEEALIWKILNIFLFYQMPTNTFPLYLAMKHVFFS